MECPRCGLLVGLGCACTADRRPRSGKRKRESSRPASAARPFRELHGLFRQGRLAWSDLDSAERASLSPEQRRRLLDAENDVLQRGDQDLHGSTSVSARSGGLPTLGRDR
ncbi:hypothetical protein GCM10023192_60800 [Amycolatopsis samaneae]